MSHAHHNLATITDSVSTAPQIVRSFLDFKDSIPPIDHRNRECGPRRPDEFDPNLYLSVLPRLRLAEGYTLDFFYFCDEDRMGGRPVLYARLLESKPFLNSDVLFAYIKRFPFTNAIITDGSPEGWFEFVVLKNLAGQFELFWHSRYSLSYMPTTKDDIARILEDEGIDDKTRKLFLGIDPRVTVSMNEETVDVSYCDYSPWRGLKRLQPRFCRQAPHIQIADDLVIASAEYDCGVRF